MPLYNCRDCGAVEAGHWHCENKLEKRRTLVNAILRMLGMLFIGTAFYFSLPYIIAAIRWIWYMTIDRINC